MVTLSQSVAPGTEVGTTTFSITLSGESSVEFDAYYNDCTTVASSGGYGPVAGIGASGPYAAVTAAGTYYIKVYGTAGNPTGTFALAVVCHS
jgi:hypothetical protein